jgi:hypothetical protein
MSRAEGCDSIGLTVIARQETPESRCRFHVTANAASLHGLRLTALERWAGLRTRSRHRPRRKTDAGRHYLTEQHAVVPAWIADSVGFKGSDVCK